MTRAGRDFDGVICFGGVDWWYHNRGHYDIQMMRELSACLPVVYVNSIGMRVPRPGAGAMFGRRVARKLRSLRHGLVQVRPGFSVLTGLALPGRAGAPARRLVLPLQVRHAARTAGMRRPLVWVAAPTAADAVGDAVGLVYQRSDRYERFEGVDGPRIAALDAALKARADLTLFCARLLHDAEAAGCRRAAFVDHGADVGVFAAAGDGRVAEPGDMRALPRPRAGFIGAIEPHTFDPALLVAVARLLPDVHFALVGDCTLPAGWCDAPNVTLLGRRPYEQVPAYMAACDVLIMPWNQSPWIEACNPIKLKEYLAVGRPVVSRPFAELEHYAGHVAVARSPADFARCVRRALADPGDGEARRACVAGQTWAARAASVLELLAEDGLVPVLTPERAPSGRRRPRRRRARGLAPSPRP
jgi:glycosyltransferase involved in cell wall biosynthesis